MIRFFCFHCGGRLKVQDDLAGQAVRCPCCLKISEAPKTSVNTASRFSRPSEPGDEQMIAEAVKSDTTLHSAATRSAAEERRRSNRSRIQRDLMDTIHKLREHGLLTSAESQKMRRRVEDLQVA